MYSTPKGHTWAKGERAGWRVVDAAKEDPTKLELPDDDQRERPVPDRIGVERVGGRRGEPLTVQASALFSLPSWFNVVTGTPRLVSVTCLNTAGGLKDKVANIKATKGFTSVVCRIFSGHRGTGHEVQR
ncbi:uncharacterized protein LAESUDRAFT_813877 [Laetiporus sulphureus 93-53]|uniref:Uncharacterized protein n=1 Tax=Laetiporus sulphureus 93-53 TaxID=1314785 RepID=A0A165DEW8_9APHY|nr:uncharacterized protein LAESUDRAFT_813877 [Laetiporus sulphureus 93-53]KZT04737.1 hypothetical protein LAESUDRAFT_813877 [Laetiporus sulphureus 93-53]